MDWKQLTEADQLNEIKSASFSKPQLIFKHSTRCSISAMALNRFERTGPPDTADVWFLDLIAYRALSDRVAEMFGVEHESPQALLIRNGACVYHESHLGISMDEIAAAAA